MQTHFNREINPYQNQNQSSATFISRLQEALWWNPPQESLPVAFCQDTSLHGLKYLGQRNRHVVERLFWFSTFVTGVVIACILISGVWEKYNNNPVIVSFQDKETKIEQIPFPAITICNVNNVLRRKRDEFREFTIKFIFKNSFIQKYFPRGYTIIYWLCMNSTAKEEEESSDASIEALRNIFYLNHICSSMALSFSQKFGYNANGSTVPIELLKRLEILEHDVDDKDRGKQQTNVKAFLQNNAQLCSDMIRLCLWQDEVKDCNEIFQAIETDFGKCCTFNMVPQSLMYRFTNDSRDNQSLVEEWAKSDLDGESLLLKSPGIHSTNFPARTKQAGSTYGLSFILNPALEEYFCATADGTGFQLVTHLPTQVPHVVDYGIAIEFKKEVYITVTPEITTSDNNVKEIPLKKRKCYFDGEFSLMYYAFYTESNCIEECVANLTFARCNCVRYYMPTDSERQLCKPAVFKCTEMVKSSLAREGLTRDCSKCLPSCTEINYVTTTSTSPIRNDVEIWIKEDGQVSDWAANNISIVHVYFGRGSSYSKIRKELYGITDLIANTGGLLGLCLGFSALSALEVVYFLTLRALYVFRSRNRPKSTSSSEISNPVKTMESGMRIFPMPAGDNSNHYSKFVISELSTYYNKIEKPRH